VGWPVRAAGWWATDASGCEADPDTGLRTQPSSRYRTQTGWAGSLKLYLRTQSSIQHRSIGLASAGFVAGTVDETAVTLSVTIETSNSTQAPVAGRYNQTTGSHPSQDHHDVTDSYITGGTVLLSHRWRHTQLQVFKCSSVGGLHREKTIKTRARQRPYNQWHPHREGAHGAVTTRKPAHWSWDRPPDGNQPPLARMPGCHFKFREASACSTLQLTGKSTASKLAEKPCDTSVWSGDSAALRRGNLK